MPERRWDTILIGEHEMIERAMDVLGRQLAEVGTSTHDPVALQRAIDFLLEFWDKIHNKKEEDFLFPLLVEHGIPQSGPIRVMLIEHQAERDLLHGMYAQAAELATALERVRADFRRRGQEYLAIRAEHIWKENDILYPMGRRAFTEQDNRNLVAAFDEITTSAYGESADQHFADMLEEVEQGEKVRKSLIYNLSMEQLDAIMETMPFEITFVDADDSVAYFNRLDKEKIFVRTRSVAGRKVQKCHPAGSLHRVQTIVDGFKDGSLDKAEFWIDFADDKVLIRYYPVRDAAGTYLGTLEVTQPIGAIQALSGEKRLLD